MCLRAKEASKAINFCALSLLPDTGSIMPGNVQRFLESVQIHRATAALKGVDFPHSYRRYFT